MKTINFLKSAFPIIEIALISLIMMIGHLFTFFSVLKHY